MEENDNKKKFKIRLDLDQGKWHMHQDFFRTNVQPSNTMAHFSSNVEMIFLLHIFGQGLRIL